MQPATLASPAARSALARMFDNASPILIEVRFPGAGTSPDWYLCDGEEEFEQIVKRLGPGAELHLNSVWDLTNRKGDLCVRK